jgi:flagellar biosynthesis protein FliR
MHAEPLSLTVPVAGLCGFLLVLARVGGALSFVPLPGFSSGPDAGRILLALSLTVGLAPLWPAVALPEPLAGGILAAVACEAAFGLTVGLAVAILIESLLVAAQIFGLQAGYSYASTVDPTTQADSNVMVVFAQLAGGLLFFSLGMDRQVLRVFAASLVAHPPGTFFLRASSVDAIIGLGAGMLATGMRLAMPVVVLLALIDISLALLGRIHQQLQLLTLAFPVKMLAALAFLALIFVLLVPVYRAAAEHTVSILYQLL